MLHKYLVNNYPGANYFSVYEAGFCGFWIHEKLTDLGITNIVVNPADVPTMSKEKLRKTDAVDCNKLARELRSGSLEGIYIPGTEVLEMRSLIRLRNLIVKDSIRAKNRIKSCYASMARRYRKNLPGVQPAAGRNVFFLGCKNLNSQRSMARKHWSFTLNSSSV